LAFSFLTRWSIALKNQKGSKSRGEEGQYSIDPFYESLITAERALRFKKIVLKSANRQIKEVIVIILAKQIAKTQHCHNNCA
jgi:hypothetical protein